MSKIHVVRWTNLDKKKYLVILRNSCSLLPYRWYASSLLSYWVLKLRDRASTIAHEGLCSNEANACAAAKVLFWDRCPPHIPPHVRTLNPIKHICKPYLYEHLRRTKLADLEIYEVTTGAFHISHRKCWTPLSSNNFKIPSLNGTVVHLRH